MIETTEQIIRSNYVRTFHEQSHWNLGRPAVYLQITDRVHKPSYISNLNSSPLTPLENKRRTQTSRSKKIP